MLFTRDKNVSILVEIKPYFAFSSQKFSVK